MGRKTPPHPAYPAWTEAKFNQFIRSALRAAWNRWPPKYEALNDARRIVTGKRHKYEYQCNTCKGWFKQKEVQVDHVEPVGTLTSWDIFVARLFVAKEKLQILCYECHAIKTKKDNERTE